MATNYRPEKHYMRGPGPKTLELIGGELRVRTKELTEAPLPDRWITILASLKDAERNRR